VEDVNQNTAVRKITFEDSLAFERLHEETYRDLGFRLSDIPAGSLEERVALVRRTIAADDRRERLDGGGTSRSAV
jgi:predicted ATPase